MLSNSFLFSKLPTNTRVKLHHSERKLRKLLGVQLTKKSISLAITLLLIFYFTYTSFENTYSDSGLDLIFDDDFKGSYKEKYLTFLSKSKNIYGNEYYTKLKLMDFLDNLLYEKIQTEEDVPIIQDPYEILNKKFSKPADFVRDPLDVQADIFLRDVLQSSSYKFSPIDDQIYRDVYNEENYINSGIKRWIKIKSTLTDQEMKFLELDDEVFQNALLNTRSKKIEFNNQIFSQINNQLKNLRFFNKFFINSEQNLFDTQDENVSSLCKTYESILFPWLYPIAPTFIKYNKNGNVIQDDLQPYTEQTFIQPNECFVKLLQSKAKGKGIVITPTNALIPELTGLIALLRTLNNELPIQVVFNGHSDLSQGSIKKLMTVATEPIMNLPDDFDKKLIKSKFPVQDLTFIDVSKSVDYKFVSYFGGWGMKLLALLFNSFEEMIMLDTDAIPLLQPSLYFDQPNYKETQTLFFRDREANSFLYDGIVDFFEGFLTKENDLNYLQLPPPSEAVLQNRFFSEKARHFMESGLFLLNRKLHFEGILNSVQMQFFKLITGSIHGEKELIWLGQQVAGNNNYKFNVNPAVAVGELSPKEDGQDILANELCSTHPGHIADDGKTLLWMNSGFLNCKKIDSYYRDINYSRNKKLNLAQLKKKYLSPLNIKTLLLPPPGEYEVESMSYPDEPSRGWVMTSECQNYLWCAYDVLGRGSRDADVPRGKIVAVPEQDTLKYHMYGEVWVNYYLIAKDFGKASSHDMGLLEDDAYDELDLDSEFDEEDTAISNKGGNSNGKQAAKGKGNKSNNHYAKGGFAKISNEDVEAEVPAEEEKEESGKPAVKTSSSKEDTAKVKGEGKKKERPQSSSLDEEDLIAQLLTDENESSAEKTRDHDIIISDKSDDPNVKSAKSKGFKITDDMDIELEAYDSFSGKKASSNKSKKKSSSKGNKPSLESYSKEDIEEAASKLIKSKQAVSGLNGNNVGGSLNDLLGKFGFGNKYSDTEKGSEIQEIQKEAIEKQAEEKAMDASPDTAANQVSQP